jgi:hypothetical protein
VDGEPDSGSPPQLGRRGSIALGAAAIAAQAFCAFTGRWLLFAASVALGVGMPVLGLAAPEQWEGAMRRITGQPATADRIRRDKARTAAMTFAIAGGVVLLAALLLR